MKKIIIMMLSFLGVSMMYAQLDYNNPKIQQASMIGQGGCNVCGLCGPEAAKAGSIHAQINKYEKASRKAFEAFLTPKEKVLFKKKQAGGATSEAEADKIYKQWGVLMKRLNKNPKFVAFKKKSQSVRDDFQKQIAVQEKACGAMWG
ncbi:hypothetical protein HOM50_03930 [bacterium]|nr:hypothetical protein [bacterium]MBT5015528.1 hypothetical protein [bacterium]